MLFMNNIEYSFIKFVNNKLILWDYLNRNQYEITPDLIFDMYSYVNNTSEYDFNTIKNLQELNIISDCGDNHWGWDCLSHIFHFGTKNVFNEEVVNDVEAWEQENETIRLEESDALLPMYQKIVDEKKGEKYIPLTSQPSGLEIEALLKRRKTTRDFLNQAIDFSSLETVLTLCYQASFEWNNGNGQEPIAKKKTSPSGGGLHPTQVYVVALNVKSIDRAVYFYNDIDNELIYQKKIPDGYQVNQLVGGQPYAKNAAFLIILTTRFDLSWIKYKHSRCYRVSLLDVGHLSQSTQLVTTELGLGSWITGQLCDSNIETLLDCDSTIEAPVYLIAIGKSSGNSFPKT